MRLHPNRFMEIIA